MKAGRIFGKGPGALVLRVDVGDRAPATEQGLHVAILPRALQGGVDPLAYTRESSEVTLDKRLGLEQGQARLARQALGAHAVE